MLCSACAHGLHLYHSAATETEECSCDFCTNTSDDDKKFLENYGVPDPEPILVTNTWSAVSFHANKEKMMKKLLNHIKENKAAYIRNTLILVATGVAIALVAYVAHNNGEDAEAAAELASE